jgi:hypothetical protein
MLKAKTTVQGRRGFTFNASPQNYQFANAPHFAMHVNFHVSFTSLRKFFDQISQGLKVVENCFKRTLFGR